MKKLLPKDFPPLLREITDPPKKLYLEGALPDPEAYIYLTVVGSRRATTYGREACERLIAGLEGFPIAVVNGLAIGIDTIALKAAIKARLPVVAIPGSGLDRTVLHPPSNRRFADEIVAGGGALLSELEPKEPAGIHTFPRRNRIMAGLSRAVLLVEAGEKSGTLITARLAMEYNRDVLAVPGSIFSPNSLGTNALIREGATPITNGAELLEALGQKLAPSGTARERAYSEHEQKVIDLLIEPIERDELIRALGMRAQEANALLTDMELKGWIKLTLEGYSRIMDA